MAGERQDPGARTMEDISAARRAAMLRFAIEQQEERHFAEALDMYRQLIDEYPATEEGNEARERSLDLAYLFGSEKQPYRMLSLYNTLETMYAPTSAEQQTEARRARVKEILEDVHEQKMREAEAEARIEAIREGTERVPEPRPEPARTPPEHEKPRREPHKRRTGARASEDTARMGEASVRTPEERATRRQEDSDLA